MEIESEFTKGVRTQKRIIKCYSEVINSLGTLSCYVGKMQLYFITSEKLTEIHGKEEGHSVENVRKTLAKYFKGEIKP